jgi:RNA polymerase sigma-70 factor, ECF subfamily
MRSNAALVTGSLRTRSSLSSRTWREPATQDIGQLFSLHQVAVRSMLMRNGVLPADADDLCGEVFVIAMKKVGGFDGRSSVSTWLLGIARNLASEHRRHARTRHEVLVDAVPESGHEDEQLEVELAQERQAVRRAVDALKPTQRAVVMGYLLDEKPMNVVAQQQQVPAQTAYARLYAAQTVLRTSLSGLRCA